MAYFDNAATTYPKPECVYAFMDEFYQNNGGNAGRGQHRLAQSSGALIKDTRTLIKTLLHCQAKQVIFEPTATIALNIIIQGLIQMGVKNIYTSPFEHNAVTRTLHAFEKMGNIQVHRLTVDEDLTYNLEKIRYQFDDASPDLVIVSHASNVIGLVAPVKEIFTLAKKYHSYTLVDMAQTAGLIDIDLGLEVFDFAVFAGHKTLFGPTGISGFVMKPEIKLPAVLFGGTGYESANQDMPESLPERFEMGTINIAGVAGLHASLEWILNKTPAQIKVEEQQRREKLIDIIHQYRFLSIVGNNKGKEYVGIVSCLMEGISSDSAGNLFSEHGIALRTGLHCAPLAHQFLNTYPSGTIRFSVNCFTSDEDFDELIEVLNYIEENI